MRSACCCLDRCEPSFTVATHTHTRARACVTPSPLARAHSAADVRAIEARLVTHSNEFSSFLPDGAADLARDFVVGDAADVEGAFVAFALARNWSLRSVHFEVGASVPPQGAAVGGEVVNGTSPVRMGSSDRNSTQLTRPQNWSYRFEFVAVSSVHRAEDFLVPYILETATKSKR